MLCALGARSTGSQNLHNEHAQCDMRKDTNFKDSDSSGFFVTVDFGAFIKSILVCSLTGIDFHFSLIVYIRKYIKH